MPFRARALSGGGIPLREHAARYTRWGPTARTAESCGDGAVDPSGHRDHQTPAATSPSRAGAPGSAPQTLRTSASIVKREDLSRSSLALALADRPTSAVVVLGILYEELASLNLARRRARKLRARNSTDLRHLEERQQPGPGNASSGSPAVRRACSTSAAITITRLHGLAEQRRPSVPVDRDSSSTPGSYRPDHLLDLRRAEIRKRAAP